MKGIKLFFYHKILLACLVFISSICVGNLYGRSASHSIIDSISLIEIEDMIFEIQALANKKVKNQKIRCAGWSSRIQKGKQRIDFVYSIIEKNQEDYLHVKEALQDNYIKGVKKFGQFYVNAIETFPSRVQRLMENGVLKNNERVRAYINRYQVPNKYKITIGDILDLQKVAEEFELDEKQIDRIKASKPDETFLNSLYATTKELEKDVAMNYKGNLKKEMSSFLDSLQTKAIANILTILRYNQFNKNSMNLDDLLLYVHAAWCLDNPTQYQAYMPFASLTFEEVKKDWDVLKIVIEKMGYLPMLNDLVREGIERFTEN